MKAIRHGTTTAPRRPGTRQYHVPLKFDIVLGIAIYKFAAGYLA